MPALTLSAPHICLVSCPDLLYIKSMLSVVVKGTQPSAFGSPYLSASLPPMHISVLWGALPHTSSPPWGSIRDPELMLRNQCALPFLERTERSDRMLLKSGSQIDSDVSPDVMAAITAFHWK